MHGPHDLSLSLEDDCVGEVAVVDTAADQENQEMPKEVRELTKRSDLLELKHGAQQRNEDFGRTNLVQHQIQTGDATPVREYRGHTYQPDPSAASQHKLHYDKRARALPLLPGERVWVRDRNRQGKGKLCTWWSSEPHVVLEQLGTLG